MIISIGNYVDETRVGIQYMAIWQLLNTSLADLSYCLIIVLAGTASKLQKMYNYDTSAFITPAEWLRYPRWGHEPPFGNHCLITSGLKSFSRK